MKRHAPATTRNSEPIAQVLVRELPETGLILEIASGTGEHIVFFARRFPHLRWQPSDIDHEALKSVEAWRAETQSPNVAHPIMLNAESERWPISQADAVLCVNMVHISAWAATEGLFAGAAGILSAGGRLIIYGPFLEQGVPTAPSNRTFDAGLKQQNAEWGLRDTADLDVLAERNRMRRSARYDMPANNIMLIYQRVGD